MAVLKYLFVVMAGLSCLECTKLIATDTLQTLETYGYSYGHSYTSNMFQTWSIETDDSNSVVEVEIEMDIQTCCCNCHCDSLQIFDGSNGAEDSLGKFCGISSSISVTSSGRKMYVVFRSDSSTQRRGFKLVYKQVKEKVDIWMIVGIVLALLITILGVALILFRCGVFKSKNQVSSIRLNDGQHQQPVWMTPRPQNHFQEVPAQFAPPPTYRDIPFQIPQDMAMQLMNHGILPGTADNAMPRATPANIIVKP